MQTLQDQKDYRHKLLKRSLGQIGFFLKFNAQLATHRFSIDTNRAAKTGEEMTWASCV